MSKKIEALWDCPYCEQTRIGGLTKHCPNCGHPQDKDIMFYMPAADEMNVLDEEESKEYGQGVDWVCGFCDSLNRYSNKFCGNCGAAKEEQSGDYFANKKDQEKKAISEKDLEAEAPVQDVNSNVKVKPKTVTNQKKEEKKKREQEAQLAEERKLVAAKNKKILLGVFVAIAALLLVIFWPRKVDTVMYEKTWNRDIAVEMLNTVEESDWVVPEGGRILKTEREIHHYEQVLDHYEDVQVEKSEQVFDGYDTSVQYVNNGDGTYSEETVETPRYHTEHYYVTESQPVYISVPVFADKYVYEIDRWDYFRAVSTAGGDDEPYWGDVDLQDNERQGGSSETYTLNFNNKKNKKNYSISVSQDMWDTFHDGDNVTLTITNGEIRKINGEEIN